MKRILVPLTAVLLFIWAPAPAAYADDVYARAEAPTAIVTEQMTNGRYRARVPLAAIRAQEGGMRLAGAAAGEDVFLAIAPQAAVESARIVLRHASGRAQKDAAPHLRVSVNGQFAAQLDAATGYSGAMDEISLAGGFFKAGFNQIRFDAVQRYTFECQDPTAPELWTEIDTQRSYVEIIYRRNAFNAGLGELDAVVSPGVGGVEKLVIVTGDGAATSDQLRWGALAAQAVANRLDYRLPDISRAPARLATAGGQGPAPRLDLGLNAEGADVVVVGTFAEVGAMLAVDPASVAPGEGFLAVGPSPADATRFVIVASGHDRAGVDRAIAALGMGAFPLSDTSQTLVRRDDAPRGVGSGLRGPLMAGAAYTFSDLGVPTRSSIGAERATTDIPFELSSDFFAREKDELILSLDFAYGAALEPDSVLNILINGQFRRAVALANPQGEATSGYEIRMPARVLRAGRNTLRLEAELSKNQQGQCAARNSRNLAFELEGSSIIRLPDAPGYVELPNLALMAETGFPFSGAAPAPFAIRAADRSSETMAAVWTIAARLGQSHLATFQNVDFDFGVAPATINTLIVGARPELRDLLPGPVSLSLDDPGPDQNDAGGARLARFADLGRNGLILSGENPAKAGTLLTVISAQSDQTLLRAVRDLVQPSHWSQMRGSAVVWRTGPSTVSTQSGGATFFSGDIKAADRVAFQNARAPWRWVLIVGALLFAVAALLAFIARYMRSRTEGK